MEYDFYYNSIIKLDKLTNIVSVLKDYQNLHYFDAFSIEQLISKSWLIDSLKKHLSDQIDIIVINGGWIGSLSLLINSNINVGKIINVDIDESTKEVAEKLLKNYGNFTHITQDMLEYEYTELPTVIINTSCEHISQENLKIYCDTLPNDSLLIFQSNDFYGVDNHINCVNSLNEFKNQLQGINIIEEQELNVCGKYNRYMIIARK